MNGGLVAARPRAGRPRQINSPFLPSGAQAGSERENGEVCEITDKVDLSSWPEQTRLIIRRERPHRDPAAHTGYQQPRAAHWTVDRPLPDSVCSMRNGTFRVSLTASLPSRSLLLVPTDATPLRPFLKWAGGKTRLLARILPHVPDTFDNYHEPFLGGGAMFFAVRERATGTAHLHDLNEVLVNVWRQVQDDPTALLEALEDYRANDSKDFYYEQRAAEPQAGVKQAARFIYLNQTAWNGLWRVNRWGQFNVPWGQRSFRGINEDMLYRTSDALIGATITSGDFRATLEKPRAGDFVYLDPPYLPLSDTSKFFLYTEKRFRAPDLAELASICRDLTERGVSWIMSNRDTEQVRVLFADHTIVRFTARRSVAAQNRRDIEAVQSPEALVIGDPIR
jgi:DNA adenine methylase